MTMSYHAWFFKVPPERVGALLGRNGRIKNLLERRLGVNFVVDEETGGVSVRYRPEGAENYFFTKRIMDGISAGFSEDDIREMIEKDYALTVVDLEEYVSKNVHLSRVKGRIIGRAGRAKTKIANYSKCKLSIYQNLVGILGPEENIEMAREAVIRLAKGFEHETTYRFMESRLRRMKQELSLWKEGKP
jgi:ribosomal RNA assembly protein